jgi:hypothetical protein
MRRMASTTASTVLGWLTAGSSVLSMAPLVYGLVAYENMWSAQTSGGYGLIALGAMFLAVPSFILGLAGVGFGIAALREGARAGLILSVGSLAALVVVLILAGRVGGH